jgi:hypothetical protein
MSSSTTRPGTAPPDGVGEAASEHVEPRPQPRPLPAPAGQGGSGQGGSGRGGSEGERTCSMTCAEAIAENLPMCPNAPQSSIDCYKALNDCMCSPDPRVGKCAGACANEACAGKDVIAGSACQQCIINTRAGCGNELNACANDM